MSGYGSMVVPVVPEPTVLLPVDGYWLRLVVLDIPDDKVATDDAADFLDTLYDIDPCVEPEPPEEPPEEGDILLAAQQVLFDEGECARLLSGDYEAEVEVVRSHPGYAYKLRLSVGTVKSTRTESGKKEEALDIDNASSITLPYPIYPEWKIQASWLGAVFADGQRIIPPPIRAVGNTLFWGFEATGTIKAHWETIYDIATIEVLGTPDPEGGFGKQHETTLTAFYIGPAVSERIIPPERDGGMDRDLLNLICGYEPPAGGGGGGTDVDDDEPVPAPEQPGYECVAYAIGPLGSEAYYEQVCCEPPPFDLMECAKWKVPKGLEKLPPEVQDAYSQYANADFNDDGFLVRVESVDFEAVGPRPSDPDGCGYDVYTIHVRPRACCEDVTLIVIDRGATPDILPARYSITIYWDGGRLPYTVRTTSPQTYFARNNQQEIVTDQDHLELVALESFCGMTIVTISDGCSVAQINIRSDQGYWELVGNECIFPGATGHVAAGSDEIRELAIGGWKQREVLNRGYWWRDGIACPVVNGDPIELCLPDCEDSVCAALEVVRPPGAFTQTCMAINPAATIGVGSFCIMNDGTSAVVHPVYTGTYSCNGDSGAGSGATGLISGLYMQTANLYAYRWVC